MKSAIKEFFVYENVMFFMLVSIYIYAVGTDISEKQWMSLIFIILALIYVQILKIPNLKK
jgi:uncharacterized MAPEG superfamily protein